MHNSTVKSCRMKWATLVVLTLGVMLSFASQQAFALFENNMSCTVTGNKDLVNLGSIAPGETFDVLMTANCRVLRTFPVGASLGHTQQYHMGKADKLSVLHANSGDYIPQQDAGVPGTVCVPSSCMRLNAGTTFSYIVLVTGKAGSASGMYLASVVLNDTSIGGWQAYGDYLQSITIQYTVTQPACSLGSAKTMNLSFGTLNSSDFATNQQVANVTMNCIKDTQVTATLVPTQAAISGSTGVSATTLAGLSMAATWADNDTAVTFSSPRSLTLKTGANTIGVGFRPRLNTSTSPTGSFSSQYTLNITYR